MGFSIQLFNFILQSTKINFMFTNTSYHTLGMTIEEYIDLNYFLEWKHRGTAISCSDIMEKCEITYDQLSRFGNEETYLSYLKFIYNIIIYSRNRYYKFYRCDSSELIPIIQNIRRVADEINYHYKKIEDDKILLVEKNPSATAVAEILEDTKVIEYNHYLLKGDVEGKRDILKLLANRFEAVKPNLNKNGHKHVADDMGYLFNNLNIRHADDELVQDMTDEELEEWYDKTYDMFLLCILANEHTEIKSDIKELKTKEFK